VTTEASVNRSKLLEQVRASQAHLLLPGEEYLTAAQVNRKSGFLGGIPLAEVVNVATRTHPPAAPLTEAMIWAATARRLVIWSADLVTKRKPKKLIGSFDYGTDVHWIRAIDKKETRGAPAGKTYLDVGLRGTIIETEIKVTSAYELAEVVDSHLPPMPPGWGAPPR
jgi:hypothetical protein